jgi:hypothetical protein
MSAPSIEDQVKQIAWTLWGVTGSNGIVGDLKDFRREFHAFVAREEERREEEAKAQRQRDRNLVLAALSVMGALLAVIVVLIVAVAQ